MLAVDKGQMSHSLAKGYWLLCGTLGGDYIYQFSFFLYGKEDNPKGMALFPCRVMTNFTFIVSTFHRFYKPSFEVLVTANICVEPFKKAI